LLRDRLLVSFFPLMLIETSVYMQAYTTLPLAMSAGGLPAQAYGLAMAVNGIVIVALQPVAGAWLGRRDHATVIACGIGFLGRSWSRRSRGRGCSPMAVRRCGCRARRRARSRWRGSSRSGPPSAGGNGLPRRMPGTVRYKFLW
jgi:hypothetical protein